MASEEDAAFDEDVILPNSPLGCYVQGLQISDTNNLFDECLASQGNTQICSNEAEFHHAQEKKHPSLFKESFLNAYKICFRSSSIFLTVPVYLMIELSNVKNCFSVIKKYKILIQDDEIFLRSWYTEHLKYEKGLSAEKRKYLMLMMIFLSILISVAVFYLFDYSSFSVFSQVLCVLLFLLMTFFIIICSVLSIEFALCFHVDSLSHHTSNILVLIKKSIRLIQEAELIARGFTAASITGATEHIELSSRLPINSCCRQYAELRRRVFSWMKNIFLKYRTKTLAVLQEVSLDTVVDFPTCLASLSIVEFGGLLNFDIDSPELVKVTDSFSISSLKTMYHVMEMQISEFFKYLIVISSLASDKHPKDWKAISYVHCLKSNSKSLSKDMNFFSKQIKYAYYYYQCIEATYMDNHDNHHSETKRDKSNLKITVHNMTLHLKAALLQLIQIENNLDFASVLEKKIENMETLRSALKIIKSEVSGFEDSFNESHKILNDLLNPEENLETETVQLITKDKNTRDLNAVLEKCDIEREITDEVFEDTIINESKGNDMQEKEFFHEEEMKKNVEMTSHLLKELKNVLIVKADEHRAREQLALAKKSTDINQTELSEIESHSCEETIKIGKNMDDKVRQKLDLVRTEKKDLDLSEVKSKICVSNAVSLDTITSAKREANSSEDEVEFEEHVKDANSIQKELSHSLMFSPFQAHSFTASIASAAVERQKLLGLTSEEFIDGTDESDSDDY